MLNLSLSFSSYLSAHLQQIANFAATTSLAVLLVGGSVMGKDR